jgi:carbonic anhydrase
VTSKTAPDVHWGYEGDIGPDRWGDLCPEFAMCKTGRAQSPIDVPSSASANPADLIFDYHPSALHIVNNGHSIQANYDADSALRVDGQSYELLQFHFHNPSETTVDGVATPMELHLVHVNGSGEIAVVGVFLAEGAHNAAYAPVFDNMPPTVGEPVTVAGVRVDAAALLPADQTYWRWDGSLTTPPCTEGVKWFMLTAPVELSPNQIAAFKALYTGNARPVQPMNGRPFIVGQQAP